MNTLDDPLSANLQLVRDRIAAACQRVGRESNSVRLVAVTKSAKWEWVQRLHALGQQDFAENRPQAFVTRAAALPQARWHLIGPLQRNKAKSVVPYATLLHAVDRLRLLSALAELCGHRETPLRILLEVNVSGEATKHGFSPSELQTEWPQLLATAQSGNLQICGLMTMAPYADDPELARPHFRALRLLRDELQSAAGSNVSLHELSMGMSGDFEVGIEEGATLVRVGSRLFEGL